MRYDDRIVFQHPDGSIELTVPAEPVRGVYHVGGESITVDALGRGRSAISAREIARLDALVAAGQAIFEPAETKAEYLQRIHDRTKAAVPHLSGAAWTGTIPASAHDQADRYFRDAWAWTTAQPVIDVDMTKARETHRERLRELRAPRFEPLERAQRTALVNGDTSQAQQLETNLQALRDVTADPAIDAAQTPDQLKAVIPAPLRN